MSERIFVRVACAATLLMLVALLINGMDVVRNMLTVADYVSPLVMAHDAHLYPGSTIQLGNYGWYNGLWAAGVFDALPKGAELAAVAPMAITVGVIGMLALQARRVWGAAAGIVVAAMALGMGGQAWIAAASWSVHWPTWWAMALAGVTVVAEAGGRRRAALVGAIATVIWAGMALTGDSFVYAVVLGPLAAVVGLAATRRRWVLVTEGILFFAAIGVSGLLFDALRRADHLIKHFFPVQPVGFESLGGYAGLALNGITQIWSPFGPTLFAAVIAYIGAGLFVWGAGGVPTVLKAERSLDRTAWTVFWVVAALGAVGAFMVNTTSNSNGAPVARYLYALPFAGAALMGALVGSGYARRLVLLAVTVLAAGAAYGLLTHPPERSPWEHAPARDNVLAAVRKYKLTRGYASYHTAYAMERASRFKLHLLPVEPCANNIGVCPFYLHRIDDAYTPQPKTKTFLLVDNSALAAVGGFEWLRVEPTGSDPVRSIDVGDGLVMKIYDHDVADLFGPLPPLDSA